MKYHKTLIEMVWGASILLVVVSALIVMLLV